MRILINDRVICQENMWVTIDIRPTVFQSRCPFEKEPALAGLFKTSNDRKQNDEDWIWGILDFRSIEARSKC